MTDYSTANIDQQELDKFGALASRWWDENSEFKPLHEINPLRLDFIDQRVGLADKKVLDVGCGGGILAESMAAKGAEVTGIDMSEAPLQVAKLHQHESKLDIDYQQITAEQLAQQQPASFDAVCCMEMLEHVPDPSAIIQACYDLVKPDGQVFFSTINRNPKAYLYAIVGAEYLLNLLPKGTHDFSKFITPAELSRWARQAGFELKQMQGMTYNPLTQHYALNEDVSVNYLLHVQRNN